MKYSSALVGLFAYTFVDAAPTAKPKADFSLVVRHDAQSKRDLDADAYWMHKRYNEDIPTTLVRRDGTAPVKQSTYKVDVSIGGQTVPVVFDTGSGPIWTFSTNLPADQQGNHVLYDPGQSTTFSNQGDNFHIGYADGSGVDGTVGTDNIELGGITANGKAFAVTTSVTASFGDDTSGILGGNYNPDPGSLAAIDQTFFDSVRDQLSTPLFTVDYANDRDGGIDFGFIDDFKHNGAIQYAAVDGSERSWKFIINGWKVGDGVQVYDAYIETVVDTGTSLINLPPGVTDDYYDKIPGSSRPDTSVGFYQFPCDASPPDLTLNFDGGAVTIPGSLVNVGQVGDGQCRGAFYAGTGRINLLGDIMFNANFVVFDVENSRVGFAPKALNRVL